MGVENASLSEIKRGLSPIIIAGRHALSQNSGKAARDLRTAIAT